jgi:glycosyl transferase family 25
MQLGIRIISLASSVERRAHMRDQMKGVSTEWGFFDAATALPDDIPYRADEARRVRGRGLTQGERGCFASHHLLWRWFVLQNEYDALCVLEDDLAMNGGFFEELPDLFARLDGIDYLRLYAKVLRPFDFIELLPRNRQLVRFRLGVFGTQAYVITRPGALRLLRSISVCRRPIDDELDRFWAHGLPIYAVFPFPVTEIDFASTIETERRGMDPLSPPDRAVRIVNRAADKTMRIASNTLWGFGRTLPNAGVRRHV